MRAKIDRSPVSLVPGDDADERKYLDGITTDNGAPSGVPVSGETQALANPGYWNLWVIWELDDATGFDLSVYWWNETSGQWRLDERVGTSGVLAVTADGQLFIEGPAARYMYVRLNNVTGSPSNGANVWVDGLEPQHSPGEAA